MPVTVAPWFSVLLLVIEEYERNLLLPKNYEARAVIICTSPTHEYR